MYESQIRVRPSIQWTMLLIESLKLNLTIICISISAISSLHSIWSYSENISSQLKTVVNIFGSFGLFRLNFIWGASTMSSRCYFYFFIDLTKDLVSVLILWPFDARLCEEFPLENWQTKLPTASAWSIFKAIIKAAIVMVFTFFESVFLSKNRSTYVIAME